MWHRYNECDVGTFPNQTYANGTGPAAALHSDASKATYNFELSWLPGQRASLVFTLFYTGRVITEIMAPTARVRAQAKTTQVLMLPRAAARLKLISSK